MKIFVATFLLTLMPLLFKAQVADEFGKMIEVNGWTIDKNTNDTLPLVAVEIYSGTNRIDVIKSDLFGYFHLSNCSSNLQHDSLIIKVLYPSYFREQFLFHFDYASSLVIRMTADPNGEVDKTVYKEFCSENMMFRCADLRSPEWTPNFEPTKKGKKEYKHYCTGEVKTYNDLALGEHDFTNWIELK